eukprot:2179222-Pyramimonas_sp.AAC.1
MFDPLVGPGRSVRPSLSLGVPGIRANLNEAGDEVSSSPAFFGVLLPLRHSSRRPRAGSVHERPLVDVCSHRRQRLKAGSGCCCAVSGPKRVSQG